MDATGARVNRSNARPVAVPVRYEDLKPSLVEVENELCRPLSALMERIEREAASPPGRTSTEQSQRIATMHRLCGEMIGLTRGYLAFVEVDRGNGALELREFSLSELVDEIDRRFAADAAARGISWTCSLEGADGRVRSDRARCTRVVEELVTNALKFTPSAGAVRVSLEPGPSTWTVTVQDNGRGVPTDALDSVFEPLHVVRLASERDCSGPGLGLSFARSLARQLAGAVDLDSELGRGTRVVARFPNHCDGRPRTGG